MDDPRPIAFPDPLRKDGDILVRGLGAGSPARGCRRKRRPRSLEPVGEIAFRVDHYREVREVTNRIRPPGNY